MAVQVLRNSTATAVFLSLQSGLARPYWEANITVSGGASTTTATLGQAYGINDIINLGTIDRERPLVASGLSRIIAGNIIMTLNNGSATYSPLATASIFTDAGGSARDYMHSTINIWAGFEDVSGTAYTIQRGSFLLTKVRVDGEKRLAYFDCEDAMKIPLAEFVGLPDISGTAQTYLPPSGTTTKAIMTELLSAVGLTAGQYDLTAGVNLPKFAIQNTKVSEALAKVAQANDGYMFTNGKGQVVFRLNAPQANGLGGGGTEMTLQDSDRIMRSKFTVDIKNLINKVQVNFTSGLDQSRTTEDATLVKGRPQSINNEIIDRPSIANAVSSEIQGQFGSNRTFIEIDNIWLPSLEIGDSITVFDTNYTPSAINFEIYKIREDIVGLKSKFFGAADLKIGTKWGFCSSSDTANCGTVFTDSWHSGFAFASNEETASPAIMSGGGFANWLEILNGKASATIFDGVTAVEMASFTGVNNDIYLRQFTPQFSGTFEDTTIETRVYHDYLLTTNTEGFSFHFHRGNYEFDAFISSTGLSIRAGVGTTDVATTPTSSQWQTWKFDLRYIGTNSGLCDISLNGAVFASGIKFGRLVSATDSSTEFRQFSNNTNNITYVDFFRLSETLGTGFDPDGNDNKIIESGVAVSGAGTTGIELPFLAY